MEKELTREKREARKERRQIIMNIATVILAVEVFVLLRCNAERGIKLEKQQKLINELRNQIK